MSGGNRFNSCRAQECDLWTLSIPRNLTAAEILTYHRGDLRVPSAPASEVEAGPASLKWAAISNKSPNASRDGQFPIPGHTFPAPAYNFPDSLRRELDQKHQENQLLIGCMRA